MVEGCYYSFAEMSPASRLLRRWRAAFPATSGEHISRSAETPDFIPAHGAGDNVLLL